MDIQADAADVDRTGEKGEHQQHAGREENKPGIEKQASRAEQQQEPQVTPTVPPAPQVRRPIAPVR